MRKLPFLLLALLFASLPTIEAARAASGPLGDDGRGGLFSSSSSANISADNHVTYGVGVVEYVDGHAVSTNRRLVELKTEGSTFGDQAISFEPVRPATYPKDSYSEFALVRDGDQVLLRIEEYWGIGQRAPAGFLGVGDLYLEHRLPVRFTSGNWEEYEAGRPYAVVTTDVGAERAALDWRDFHLVGAKPKSIRAEMMSSVQKAEYLAQEAESLRVVMRSYGVEFDGAAEDSFLNGAVDGAEDLRAQLAPTAKVISFTPRIGIEASGTKAHTKVKYLDAFHIHQLITLKFPEL